jgi:DNA-binding beta-propeller fold protein YncE
MKTLLLAGLLAGAVALNADAKPAPSQPGYAVAKQIPWTDGRWDYVRTDPEARRIYVAHGDTIMVIDPASDTIHDLGHVNHAHQVFALPGSKTLLETDEGTSAVRLLDAATGEDRASIPAGKKPDAAIWDDKRKLALVVNGVSGSISVVDAEARKVVRTVELKPGLEYAALDGQGRFYVANQKQSVINVIDVDTGKLVRTLKLPGCEGPTGMAYAALADRMVTSCDNGVAVLINPKTFAVTGGLRIGHGSDAVIYDGRRHRVLIPAGDDGVLSVFRETAAGLTPLGSIKTAVGARTGDLDPETGRVYLPTSDFQPGTTPDAHKFAPGTFRVIVVAPVAGSGVSAKAARTAK